MLISTEHILYIAFLVSFVHPTLSSILFMLIGAAYTHLVAFLVSFVHHILSKYQNQTSTFVLMSVFII